MSSLWTVRRSTADSKLVGLCGGLGRHWNVDPVLIRVGFVVLALSGGIGLVLYLAGWMLVPADGKERAPLYDILGEQARRWPREAWIVIVAACCILTFTLLNAVTPFGLGPAIVLALIWYFGYYRHRSTDPRRPAAAVTPGEAPAQTDVAAPPQFFSYAGPATPFTEAATAWRQRVEEATRAASQPATYRGVYDAPAPAPEDLREPVGPAASLPPAQPFGAESVEYNSFLATPDPVGLYREQGLEPAATAPVRVKRHATPSAKRLRLVALVAVGLVLSGLAAADTLGVPVPLATYFASTLLILGLTLVAATWFGRARGILPVALLVMLATLGSTASGAVAGQGWGERTISYTTAAELSPGDDLQAGRMVVDLTRLTTRTDASYTAHVGLGDLEVSTPKNVNVIINWRVKSGALLLDGQQTQGGSNQSGTVRPPTLDPKKRTLTVNLSVDRGVVQVRR